MMHESTNIKFIYRLALRRLQIALCFERHLSRDWHLYFVFRKSRFRILLV